MTQSLFSLPPQSSTQEQHCGITATEHLGSLILAVTTAQGQVMTTMLDPSQAAALGAVLISNFPADAPTAKANPWRASEPLLAPMPDDVREVISYLSACAGVREADGEHEKAEQFRAMVTTVYRLTGRRVTS